MYTNDKIKYITSRLIGEMNLLSLISPYFESVVLP